MLEDTFSNVVAHSRAHFICQKKSCIPKYMKCADTNDKVRPNTPFTTKGGPNPKQTGPLTPYQ